MKLTLNPRSLEDYRTFCKIKTLPAYRIRGRVADVPDEYAGLIGSRAPVFTSEIELPPSFFDYQSAITKLAIEKRKFAVFADCGLGKSLILLGYAWHAARALGRNRRVLLLTPPMVVPQLVAEAAKFLPGMPIEIAKASTLQEKLATPGEAIIVCNYEGLKKGMDRGLLGALVLDESSLLKSHYGHYGAICIEIGKGLEWKLTATGTPAPNDRIEFANQAVFLDRFPTVNSFLAKFFINRGETNERWELKPHALRPFYRALSDWSIFLTNPAVYGWKDNCQTLPPIHTHIHHVELTQQQRDWIASHLGALVATRAGGLKTRGAYGQVAKGHWKGQRFETNKPGFIADLVNGWRESESTLAWCLYDEEQASIHAAIGGESLWGKTPTEQRIAAVDRFKSGESRVLISKSQILGFGLNLQVATRQVFSGVEDSYEKFYQCVKRSNRVGSTKPLNVHIPITELEEAMLETVLRKADRVEADTREQEQMFLECMVRS